MPLPNRVRPDGSLVADPARGLLMGNRGGKFHDATRTLPRRLHANRQWICCVLAFKGRQREVWGRSYTELFFCDEVTALAAGHRPCVECRRRDAHAYRAALVAGLGLAEVPLFPAIDARLDGERREGRRKRLHRLSAHGLPDGTMIAAGPGVYLALMGDLALPWSPSGYGAPQARPCGEVAVLTPPTTIAALSNGYRPLWHASSADSGRSD